MIMCLAITSCIQDEVLNVEAAIDGCNGSNIQLSTINTYSKTVSIYVSKATDLSTLEIQFDAWGSRHRTCRRSGQTIMLLNMTFQIQKFPLLRNRHWSNTSVSSEWHPRAALRNAVYMITVIKSELPTEYHFENIEDGNNKYHIFYEFNLQKAEMLQWASGNPASTSPVWRDLHWII